MTWPTVQHYCRGCGKAGAAIPLLMVCIWNGSQMRVWVYKSRVTKCSQDKVQNGSNSRLQQACRAVDYTRTSPHIAAAAITEPHASLAVTGISTSAVHLQSFLGSAIRRCRRRHLRLRRGFHLIPHLLHPHHQRCSKGSARREAAIGTLEGRKADLCLRTAKSAKLSRKPCNRIAFLQPSGEG